MKNTEKDVDYAALLDDDYAESDLDDALSELIDSVHLGAPVTAKLDEAKPEQSGASDKA